MIDPWKKALMRAQGQSAFDVPTQITEAWMLLTGRGHVVGAGRGDLAP